MPVSHKFEINIGIIGFKADAGYGSSVKYLEVKPNLTFRSLLINFFQALNATDENRYNRFKTKKQIDKILEKDELSNRDMVKLSRLMEKESEAEY